MDTLQLPLFDDLTRAPARAAPAVEVPASSGRPAPAAPEECEGWLFDSAVMLQLAIDEALEDGRFDDARRCYESLVEQWGHDPRMGDLAFLDRLELAAGGPPGCVLRHWVDVVPLSAIGGRRAWRGLTRRLLEVHGAGALVAAEPRCLVPLAGVLADLSRELPALAAQADAQGEFPHTSGGHLADDGAPRVRLLQSQDPDREQSLRKSWSPSTCLHAARGAEVPVLPDR